MNNINKFRAWDGLDTMIYFDLESIKHDGLIDWNENKYSDTGGGLYIANCDVMQYTGLKDKNDKEIYEGDILKVNGCYQDKFIVEFSAPTFCLFDGRDGVLASEDFGWDYWEQSEVIGNIYETPELLDNK
jgi:uncharacterized phage protein (TIGR01671 family)